MQTNLFEQAREPRPHEIPAVRLQLVREPSAIYAKERIGGSKDIFRIVREFIGDPNREHLVAIYLDAINNPLALHVVSIGGVDVAQVHPSEVFKPALLCNARAIIIAHNHPSGDPTASQADRRFTDLILEGARLLGLRLIDHVILGDGRWESFADRGWL